MLWFAADDVGVATTSASIVDPSDLSTANWTRTGMSAVGGTVTSTAVTATVQQVPANFSTGAMQWSATFRVTYVSNGLSDWIAFEFFAAASGRAWVNLSTGATGTVGGLVSVSVTALGGGTYDITFTTVSAGGNYVMLRGASADNTLTCAVGWSATVVNVSIAQTRCTAFLNMVSAVSWAEASANLQPRYSPAGLNGRPAIDWGGQQGITSTEAAVVAALVNGADHTFFSVVANVTAGTLLGAAAAAVNTNRTKIFTTSGTSWRYQTVDDAGAAITNTSTSGAYAAGSHLVVWKSTAGALVHRQDIAAQTLDSAANAPVTLTPTRVALGQRPDLTPDTRLVGQQSAVGLWNTSLDAAATSRVEAYLRLKWGTP